MVHWKRKRGYQGEFMRMTLNTFRELQVKALADLTGEWGSKLGVQKMIEGHD
jgi:hypothetical protein